MPARMPAKLRKLNIVTGEHFIFPYIASMFKTNKAFPSILTMALVQKTKFIEKFHIFLE